MSSHTVVRSRSGARAMDKEFTPKYLGEDIKDDLQKVSERYDGGTMNSRILVAAVALFAERGYENLSMRTLASWVELKASSLYNYYDSKEQILISAIELGMTDFFGYILEDIKEVPREKRLVEIVNRHAHYKMRHRLIARANDRLIDPQFMRMFLPDEVAQGFTQRTEHYRCIVEDLVRDYLDDNSPISPKIATLSILSLCDRLAYWYNPLGKLSPELILNQVLVMVYRILGISAE